MPDQIRVQMRNQIRVQIPRLLLTFGLAFAASASACAQTAPQPPAITRIDGTDPGSGIQYALLSIPGKAVGEASPPTSPRLTAWCTRDASGKPRFELSVNPGTTTELKFIPPWRPGNGSLFEPAAPRTQVTMEFLGYARVKPVRRVWISVDGLPDELKYSTPGLASPNMESVQFYLQYLKALPTLRLTFPASAGARTNLVLEFETTRWQSVVRSEPLCSASSL